MIKTTTFRSILISITIVLANCSNEKEQQPHIISVDTATTVIDNIARIEPRKIQMAQTSNKTINEAIQLDSILAFAKTLLGIPYLYASTDPEKGFDCSGFITYVFNHFNITVPRSSVDFTDYGKEIDFSIAKPGDLILFTGTDSTSRIVGHMGIVESNEDGLLKFIHSTSGKAKGVVITALEKYYRSRFVKVIRVFSDEMFQ